jgi:hypothetical protein
MLTDPLLPDPRPNPQPDAGPDAGPDAPPDAGIPAAARRHEPLKATACPEKSGNPNV